MALRLAIIGAGPAGAQVMYPPALAGSDRFEVAWVYDPDRKNSAALVDAIGQGRPAASLQEALTDGVEAAIIASPVQFHRPQAIAALESGLHVLVEKPMARTLSGCRAIQRAAAAAGRVLMVGFMKRFDRSFERATEMVAGGELGTMIEVRCDWSHRSPFPAHESRAHPQTWGGTFQDHGSHTIDLCRLWLGDIEQVSAEMKIAFGERYNEDVGAAICLHAQGAISTHNISRVHTGRMMESYDLVGTRGRLRIQYSGRASYASADPFQMTFFGPGGTTRDLTVRPLANIRAEIARNGRYARELNHFADCIAGEAENRAPGDAGSAAVEAVNAAFASAASGAKVTLPLQVEPDLAAFFEALRNGARDRDRR
ncbi:MAG: Gfo/Idh/MocA family oxidoreductase [Chloroflexi bacterium]|nr:Gfo/Idh/MocA family oxidoreductase [Chloroflexota bacterium]MXX99992.1 Gfo/Idh/MocA family oxidoreductase [Chloroflexota bacterium]